MFKFTIFGFQVVIRIYRVCPWCKDGERAVHKVHGCPIGPD